MKERASFTLDKSTVESIYMLINDAGYRNKSHVVEAAIKFLAEAKLQKNESEKA